MKYDDLQTIANAIINSNDRLILLNLIMLLFAIVGIYCSSFIKKKAELDTINRNFKKIADQNRAITTDTEMIKGQLSKVTIEYQIRLSRYHEKQINAIENVHSKLAVILNVTRKIFSAGDHQIYTEFNKAVADFRDTFEIEKLWLDESVSTEIENFAIEVDMQVKKYQGANIITSVLNASDSQITRAYDTQDEFYDFTVSTSKKLKNKLDELLRAYLSPN